MRGYTHGCTNTPCTQLVSPPSRLPIPRRQTQFLLCKRPVKLRGGHSPTQCPGILTQYLYSQITRWLKTAADNPVCYSIYGTCTRTRAHRICVPQPSASNDEEVQNKWVSGNSLLLPDNKYKQYFPRCTRDA